MIYEASCPDCGKQANGKDDVVDRFGLRNYRGSVYVQSWCKDCRTRERREKALR